MKKCLLIGGAGFIGSNMAKCFALKGYDVTVYDMIENPFKEKSEFSVTYRRGDYFRDKLDNKLLKGQDIVVLLACSVGPKSSMENPDVCYGLDISKMIELLEAMKIYKVKRLAFVSSGGTVYGNNNSELLSESMPTNPINHYGIMKLTQEKILIMYNQLFGMNNVIFRLSNPYGPGQRVSSGIGAITSFMNHILSGEPISVYGKGEVIRDYIYIDDVTQIIYNYFECQKEELNTLPIYNIGTGYGTSLMESIRIIESITGKKANVQFSEEREIDVKRNVLSNEKILMLIGEYTCQSVEMGIKNYYESLEKRKY